MNEFGAEAARRWKGLNTSKTSDEATTIERSSHDVRQTRRSYLWEIKGEKLRLVSLGCQPLSRSAISQRFVVTVHPQRRHDRCSERPQRPHRPTPDNHAAGADSQKNDHVGRLTHVFCSVIVSLVASM